MRIIRVGLTYLKVGILNELQYRINFFLQVLQSFIALGTGLIGLWLVFDHTNELNGWTRPELLAVMGVHILMGGVIQAAIQPNMQLLMEDIRQGTLDFALTKPVDAQAIVSVRQFRLWSMTDVLMGLIILGAAIYEIQREIGIAQALSFVAALIMGALMIYCFWLMVTSSAFWIIRVEQIVELFQGLYAAGRWPVGIYPPWLRAGLTFLVPVAFAVTVPAEALVGRLTNTTLLGAALLTAALLVAARIVWRLGLRSYSGASA
jgi:ABC-2 type transport system permease protein